VKKGWAAKAILITSQLVYLILYLSSKYVKNVGTELRGAATLHAHKLCHNFTCFLVVVKQWGVVKYAWECLCGEVIFLVFILFLF
jgi:hypothetical protein